MRSLLTTMHNDKTCTERFRLAYNAEHLALLAACARRGLSCKEGDISCMLSGSIVQIEGMRAEWIYHVYKQHSDRVYHEHLTSLPSSHSLAHGRAYHMTQGPRGGEGYRAPHKLALLAVLPRLAPPGHTTRGDPTVYSGIAQSGRRHCMRCSVTYERSRL